MSKKALPDLCNGPILSKLIKYTVPIMLATMLQLLFVTVDKMVLGKYVSDNAMGAVGATNPLIHLIINVFNGLAVGVSVAVARYYGAKDEKGVSQVVHTSVITALFCGVIIMLVGIFFCRPMLSAMDTPGEQLGLATTYLRIYFIGAPLSLLYNYCAAALRAVGDTIRPMIILTASGVLNLGLNLLLILGFGMGVEGVAWATVASQALSAVLVVILLIRSDNCCKLVFKRLKVTFSKLAEIIKLGLPAGIQGLIFSFSNVTIQSGINSFGEIGTSGNTAASDLEGYMNAIVNSFYNSAMTFVGQNVGAKRSDRIDKIFKTCALSALVACFGICGTVYLFRYNLLGIYTSTPEIVEFGLYKLRMLCLSYFTYGLMQVFIGAVRGMGVAVTPMLISLGGICGVRMLWLYTAFAAYATPTMLYLCYPVSWAVTAILQGICYVVVRKRFIKNNPLPPPPAPAPSEQEPPRVNTVISGS